MKIQIEASGVGLEVGRFVLGLFVGDFYVRLPNVGEVAWNQTGLHLNRLPIQTKE